MNGCLKIEHDPHVGIEWEPQFTLLNHEKKAVYFNYLSDYKASKASITRLWESEILTDLFVIGLPVDWRSKYLSIDNKNIEVRTKHCGFSRLEEEIKKSQKRLERFTLRLAKDFGPVGVFLPSSNPCDYNVRCYKHFNIKILDYDNLAISKNFFCEGVQRINELYGPSNIVDIKAWYSKHHRRVHIKVPYDFDGYDKITVALRTGNMNSFVDIIETALENASEKPILLGYSYGMKYIRRNSLI